MSEQGEQGPVDTPRGEGVDEAGEKRGFESVAAICTLFALLLMLFAIGGAVNTSLDLDLAVSISGAEVELPDDWDVVVPLFVLAGIFFGLAQVAEYFYVLVRFIAGQKIVVAAVSLVVVGVAVTGYYTSVRYALEGGKLPWAVIEHRPDVFDEALSEGVTKDELVAAGMEAAHKNRGAMMKKLLSAGMPVNPNEGGTCLLSATVVNSDPDVLVMELEAGAEPMRCYEKSQMLARFLLREDLDAKDLPIVLRATQLLVERGVDPHDTSYQHPFETSWRNKSALDIAREKQLVAVARFLESVPRS